MEKLNLNKLIANDIVNYGMDKTTSFNYIVSLYPPSAAARSRINGRLIREDRKDMPICRITSARI